MTKLEIIEETAVFYIADTSLRSKLDGHCAYYGENGAMCAVGRCLDKNIYISSKNNLADVDDLVDELIDNSKITHFDDIFDENHKGHSQEFWKDLQKFHDENTNWTASGLTDNGNIALKQLKNKYK